MVSNPPRFLAIFQGPRQLQADLAIGPAIAQKPTHCSFYQILRYYLKGTSLSLHLTHYNHSLTRVNGDCPPAHAMYTIRSRIVLWRFRFAHTGKDSSDDSGFVRRLSL
jgi:hypothetical protein